MIEKYIGKILLIARDGCNGCRKAEEILRDKIDSGEVEVVKIDDPEGKRIAELLRINYVPSFASVTKRGDKIKICRLDIFEEKVKECFEL